MSKDEIDGLRFQIESIKTSIAKTQKNLDEAVLDREKESYKNRLIEQNQYLVSKEGELIKLTRKKWFGGNQCNVVCKKKCKKNCTTYCELAREDKTEFKESMDKLKDKRDKLKDKLKIMEDKEKEHEQKRIKDLIRSYNLSETDKDILRRKLKKEGGTKRKTKQIKKTKMKTKKTKSKGGFSWFGNSSLEPCEKSCTDKCEPQCKSICTDASFLAHDNKEVVSLQNEIKLLELSIDRIESKLNL
jgi:hypothetical protein